MLLVSGFGYSIQLMKAGLNEVACIIVTNKPIAKVLKCSPARSATKSCTARRNRVKSMLVEAANDVGVGKIFEELERRRKILKS